MEVIRDPLYRLIDVEDEFIHIIAHPIFQRLRFIKQNANLFYVYPSAKHDRFSHCLGTYHLMKQITDNKLMKLSKKEKFNLKAAALLHDVGHGPYSHSWENVSDNYDHEEMTVRIMKEIFGLNEAARIVEKKHPLHPFLSSVIDTDKMDYMPRDSYFCGVSYGSSDVERIVRYVSVKNKKICIEPKVVSSVEHVIMGRISLYKSTYFHKSVIARDALFKNIFKRVKYLRETKKEIYVDELLERMLYNKKPDLNDFLSFNESLIEFHFYKWKNSSDSILKDLIMRWNKSDGFSAIQIDLLEKPKSKIKNEVIKKFDKDYYFSEVKRTKKIYESEVYVTKGKKLIPLRQFSKQIKQIWDANINLRFVVGPTEIFEKYK